VSTVREAVRDRIITDDEVLAVLQCFDYNVDQTVAAFQEGSAIVACDLASDTAVENYLF